MKPILLLVSAVALMCLSACSGGARYDSELCEELSVKIERRDSITQKEYTDMIGQNEAILRYLIEQSKTIADEPSDERNGSWRTLLADPEYMERFSYMFTLGSALYQADVDGRLDSRNKELYRNLDKYNQELADYSDMGN
ncbi:MAG: hypothetical protein NC418_03945 [Muribaculaceae bacterium]|nr:hypothetical protein [Muribaculaceae bacterium]